MSLTDVELLRRRIDTLARAAAKLRAHAGDLHDLGWEPARGDVEKVNGGAVDHSPRSGNPKARDLFARVLVEVGRMEAEAVGLERAMMALFFAGSTSPEPSRGSLISRGEFDQLRDRQRQRSAPVRLVDQPQHPGRRTDAR